MFVYCRDVLHLSEHAAYLRIEVARASRRHPVLLEMLADGRLHLSGIAILHRHLTEANQETILKRAAYRSKRQIEELVAELYPKPDVPTTMRKLPQRREAKPTHTGLLGPDLVPPHSEPESNNSEVQATVQSQPAPVRVRPPVVKPLAPARYEIRFTATAEFRDKLERLRALMRTSVPDGDLATVIQVAATEKLERLESKRFGKTKAPRKSVEETDTVASSRYIPAPVRRAVYTRDSGQCSFVDENGHRCTERNGLQFHHLQPFGRGGGHGPDNLVLLCHAHNDYIAERDYGKQVIKCYRRSSSRVSEPSAVYYVVNRAAVASTIRDSEMCVTSIPQRSHSPPHVIGKHRP